MGILETLEREKIPASAFVWVHAQNEKNLQLHIRAARAGAWIEFDGVNARSADAHLTAVTEMVQAGFADKLLISQDSGWYRVGEPGGGQFNGFTYLFTDFLPRLRSSGLTDSQIDTLLIHNPARALTFS